jgi:hypothetical protein
MSDSSHEHEGHDATAAAASSTSFTERLSDALQGIIGFAGLAVVVTGAYFGGHLVFHFAIGVDHTAT